MIKAAIFEMDGLLIDSEPLWTRAFQDAFKTIETAVTEDDMLDIRGMRNNEGVDHLFHKYKLDNSRQQEILDLIVEDMVNLIKKEGEPLPGARHALEICQRAGLPLAIASSSYVKVIDAVVDTLQLREFFHHIYSAEHEEYGKPHPGVFIQTAKLLETDPRHCLVFEDAPNGVLAAKAAKMKLHRRTRASS